MFDEFAKDLEKYQANVPKVFKAVALRGAKFAENTAKEITDREGLVETGNYKRNWFAECIESEANTYGILLENNAEYAKHLECGHKTKNGGRVKGKFVGQQTLDETRYYCVQSLSKALDTVIRKHHESFITPKE